MIVLINRSGFFSNYIKFLSWNLTHGVDNKIVFHFIDRGVYIIDRVHDIDRTIYDKQNIWEWMFHPVHKYTIEELKDTNNRFETYFPNSNYPWPLTDIRDGFVCNVGIYSSPEFPLIRQLFNNEVNKLVWTSVLNTHMDKEKKVLINPDKTIAVFIRFANHYNSINSDIFKEEIFVKLMDEIDFLMKEKGLEYLYLVTMVDVVFDKITERFGDKVIITKNKRYVDINDDWSKDETIDYQNECVTCFTEVYLASLCKFIIGGSSNMVLGSLFMNPSVEFKLFDALKHYDGL
jgi:hypothetical protein